MHAFYQTPIAIGKNVLSKEESHHLARVLRMQVNETVTLLDGLGKIAEGKLTKVHDKTSEVTVETVSPHPPLTPQIHLYLAPPKSNERLDFIVEKSCELGVTSIQFVHCRNSERKKIRLDKLEQKVIAACKQSLNPWFPVLRDFVPLTDIEATALHGAFFFNCRKDVDRQLLLHLPMPAPVNVFIGPEGDFSTDEIQWALGHKATPTTLGPQRLRTETAVLAAIVQIQTLFDAH